jgi:hypothetical protein
VCSSDLDIVLLGPQGPLTDIARTEGDEGGQASEYITDAVSPPDLNVLTDTRRPIYTAYVLVSHGQNGLGAPLQGGGSIAGAAAPEDENADGDQTFYITDRLTPAQPTGTGSQALFRNQIDDIVYWQTQAQVLGRLGDMSCTKP